MRIDKPEEIILRVSKRTVYSESEIRSMSAHGSLLVILFRFIRRFDEPVPRTRLQALGVGGNIQSIRELPKRAFETLFRPLLERRP